MLSRLIRQANGATCYTCRNPSQCMSSDAFMQVFCRQLFTSLSLLLIAGLPLAAQNLVEKAKAKKAIAAGVKVALGTDAAVYPHGLNAHELDVYVNQFGMTPLTALQTGTSNAADLMGWSDRISSIEAGKWADVIAVDGHPLKDVRVLQHVSFVMKAGVVYKSGGSVVQ
jgi:imidazolonepropionase-like amidohydrolase